jgi:hypothetical protein
MISEGRICVFPLPSQGSTPRRRCVPHPTFQAIPSPIIEKDDVRDFQKIDPLEDFVGDLIHSSKDAGAIYFW